MTSKEILSNTKTLNSCFIYDIKDLYIDKASEKSCLVKYTYNNEKKNFMLMHLSKIPGVSQVIGFCFITII